MRGDGDPAPVGGRGQLRSPPRERAAGGFQQAERLRRRSRDARRGQAAVSDGWAGRRCSTSAASRRSRRRSASSRPSSRPRRSDAWPRSRFMSSPSTAATVERTAAPISATSSRSPTRSTGPTLRCRPLRLRAGGRRDRRARLGSAHGRHRGRRTRGARQRRRRVPRLHGRRRAPRSPFHPFRQPHDRPHAVQSGRRRHRVHPVPPEPIRAAQPAGVRRAQRTRRATLLRRHRRRCARGRRKARHRIHGNLDARVRPHARRPASSALLRRNAGAIEFQIVGGISDPGWLRVSMAFP